MRLSPVAIVILLSSLLALSIFCPSAHASDESVFSGYSYSKTGYVAGSTDGALSDYQVKVVVHKNSGNDYGQDVYLDGHSLSWPNDIRFASSDNQVYPYFIESYDADTAVIRVKFDRIPAYPDEAAFDIYYGKAGDVSQSDGDAVFAVFDPLTDDSRRGTIWKEDHNTAMEGYPDIHRFDSGGYHIVQKSYSDRNAEIALAEPLDGPAWCGVTLQVVSERGIRFPPWTRAGVNFSTNIWGYGYWGDVCTGYDVLPGHTYRIEWTKDGEKDNLQLYENEELIASRSTSFPGMSPGFGVRTADDAKGEWYFRDFYTRAYTPNQPEPAGWGVEKILDAGVTEGPRESANASATPEIRDPKINFLPLACCGGCVCGTGIILFLILVVLVVYDERRHR